MKPSYFAVVIALAAFFSISSCSKEELTNSGGGGSTGSPSPKNEIDLTASNCTRVISGIYTCPLPNAIPPGNASNRVVNIYVLTADKKIQINSPVDFMGGQLSAIVSGINISLNYHLSDNRPLPFSYLNIKVVIQ